MKNKKNRLVYYLLNNSTESTEYKIIVNKDSDSTNYELYRIGDGWTEMAKSEACYTIEDHGDGVNTSVVSDMGYHEFQEFQQLFPLVRQQQFLHQLLLWH